MRLNCLVVSEHTLVHPGHSCESSGKIRNSRLAKETTRMGGVWSHPGRPLPAEKGMKVGRVTGKQVAMKSRVSLPILGLRTFLNVLLPLHKDPEPRVGFYP